ncbi:tryptophan synthase subunit alpha [Mangrovibacillus cuniculi]|uniref:Tryptophan synthase alpha chain n=2 Tax=Mangrovibacillus cuniculi TaxID=2593652 RepID=A0A7S8CEA3_9BACI|nr:tryptophan synthase subunit alpha [Mangrovibacillus cuniculi]
MSFLEKKIKERVERNKPVLVPYIMAGDGGLEETIRRIVLLQEAGVTAIEIGIPFSDPVADGPTIERAGIRALEKGTTLTKVLDKLIEEKNRLTVPLVIMSYVNPIFQLGLEKFAQKCAEANIQAVIIPDLPYEEQPIISPILQTKGIGIIQLVTITSSNERVDMLAKNSHGFLYAVTVAGTTGVKRDFSSDVVKNLERVNKLSPVPVLAGFGISTSKQVEDMSKVVDGVVVGSKIVSWFDDGEEAELLRFIDEVHSIDNTVRV